MIRINNKKVDINYFPDKTLLLKETITDAFTVVQKDTEDKKMEIEIKWSTGGIKDLSAEIYLFVSHCAEKRNLSA